MVSFCSERKFRCALEAAAVWQSVLIKELGIREPVLLFGEAVGVELEFPRVRLELRLCCTDWSDLNLRGSHSRGFYFPCTASSAGTVRLSVGGMGVLSW